MEAVVDGVLRDWEEDTERQRGVPEMDLPSCFSLPSIFNPLCITLLASWLLFGFGFPSKIVLNFPRNSRFRIHPTLSSVPPTPTYSSRRLSFALLSTTWLVFCCIIDISLAFSSPVPYYSHIPRRRCRYTCVPRSHRNNLPHFVLALLQSY